MESKAFCVLKSVVCYQANQLENGHLGKMTSMHLQITMQYSMWFACTEYRQSHIILKFDVMTENMNNKTFILQRTRTLPS